MSSPADLCTCRLAGGAGGGGKERKKEKEIKYIYIFLKSAVKKILVNGEGGKAG